MVSRFHFFSRCRRWLPFFYLVRTELKKPGRNLIGRGIPTTASRFITFMLASWGAD
jgi:hypothetical protein